MTQYRIFFNNFSKIVFTIMLNGMYTDKSMRACRIEPSSKLISKIWQLRATRYVKLYKGYYTLFTNFGFYDRLMVCRVSCPMTIYKKPD